MGKKVKTFISNYWIVLLVGAVYALTATYNTFGSGRDVLWNTFIKTVREGFLIFLLYKHIEYLNNSLSILFCLGAIAISLSYMVFRFSCAAFSGLNYEIYYDMMKNTNLRLIMSFIIFIILLLIKYLNNKGNG